MTKKDYIKVAELLRKVDASPVREELIETFCGLFQTDNPRFDAAVFRLACEGIKTTPRKLDRLRSS